jgi:hypothetical protein
MFFANLPFLRTLLSFWYRPKGHKYSLQKFLRDCNHTAQNCVLFIFLRDLIYKEGLSIMGSLLARCHSGMSSLVSAKQSHKDCSGHRLTEKPGRK